MKKIGVTGANGFVGYHLIQNLSILEDEFKIIPFNRSYFSSPSKLDEFVKKCDVIVHLAALNRHNNPEEIYRTNLSLVKKLTEALIRTESKAHVLHSSSTQEERDNPYGKSKKEGRLIFSKWAEKYGGRFTGMIIPNVFGPFGHPNYNSVIATFSYQLTNYVEPVIDIDSHLKLIYVQELIKHILDFIRKKNNSHKVQLSHTAEAKVSELLALLKVFRETYQERGGFPALTNEFEKNLFNTYRCFMDLKTYFPRSFNLHADNRGAFLEIARHETLGQTSFSTTVPGITRGNHFHTRKIERFAVIKGKALIQLRRIGTKDVLEFELDGKEPAYVDMPIWYTHNIKNIGDEELYTIFWINEFYNEDDPDTYFEIV